MPKQRTYRSTHPWVTFQVDLSRALPPMWVKLGECQALVRNLAGVPLRPATARELHKVYLARGALATTAIEGNTLSEAEVLQLLEGELELPPSREYLADEIQNVVVALNAVADQVEEKGPLRLNAAFVRMFNEWILRGLDVEEGVVPGQYRDYSAVVGNYRCAPPEDCEFLMDQLFEWLHGSDFSTRDGLDYATAVLKAILAHLYLVWIHPFGDGNGRTARLVEVALLLSAGVPYLAAHLLSDHYNQTRTDYYRQLASASVRRSPLDFICYAIDGFLDGLREQLRVIRAEQQDIAWRNFVHESFGRLPSNAKNARRRHLVLDLSAVGRASRAEIMSLTPRLAVAYDRKTKRTASRDLRALVEMGLVVKETDGYEAATGRILAFLPRMAAKQAGESSK